nr:trypsin-like peptidase domain-containing protein [Thioalkalivibrio sp. ALJ15]
MAGPYRMLHGAGLVLVLLAVVSAAGCAISQPTEGLDDERNTIAVAREAGPSVVSVRVSRTAEEDDAGPDEMTEVIGGSGFVVNDEGQIITNFHVIAATVGEAKEDRIDLAPGATLTVSFLGTPEVEHDVRVVGANPDVDLALLELVDPAAAPDPGPIPLGDSDRLQVGQKAIAIGNPFGLHSTVTAGIVSALERERPGLVGIEIPYIQTDAAINPGNSGGPLLDSSGEAVGVNNAILAPAGTFAGIGLAVPSNLVAEAMAELRAGGFSGLAAAAAQLPERPRMGMEVALRVVDYPRGLRAELGLPEHGVVVTDISADGPAERAGIRRPENVVLVNGRAFPVDIDVITHIDGQRVTRPIDIQRVILGREEGDVVTLRVWRDGTEREVEVALEIVPLGED